MDNEKMKMAAETFERLVKAVDNAPYNYEIDERLAELREDLQALGLDIQR